MSLLLVWMVVRAMTACVLSEAVSPKKNPPSPSFLSEISWRVGHQDFGEF
jgi:hypothetical protein